MVAEPAAFFVYGTLKQGQSNYPLIAAAVRAAIPAMIRGRLYDVGPFPALAEGEGLVRGEVLSVDPDELPRLLVLLDQLEGYDSFDTAGSLYVRRVVEATATDGELIAAYVYVFNRDPAGMRPLPDGEWLGPSAVEVSDQAEELVAFGRHVRAFRR